VVGPWAAVKEALDRLGLLTVDTTFATGAAQSPRGAWTVPGRWPAPARPGPSISSSWTRGWRPAGSPPSRHA